MARQIIAHQYFLSNVFNWIRLLFQNGGVSLRYIPKAIAITILVIISFPFQALNWLLWKYKESKLPPVEDPIFIIGHWRGGTTYMHYLLAKDQRLGYLTYYQAFAPNLSTIGGNWLKGFLARLMPSKRPQDNIKMHMDFPMEEENPISNFSMHSASHSFFFPDNEKYYKKYVMFDGIRKHEKKKWQNAYRSMLSQISTKFPGRRLLIKNPHNTGRITELLEIYPKAKFIHIYRNPYEIFPSTLLMYDRVVKTQFLKSFSNEQVEQKIIYYYTSIMKKYFEERTSVPANQLVEVKFEDFEEKPLEHVKSIYAQLEIDLDDDTFAQMKAYVDSLKDYKKNQHEISAHIKAQIEKDWKFAFDELGYKINVDKESSVESVN